VRRGYPDEMRVFALDCLRWADEARNAGHRDLMIRVARTWMATASAIDRRITDGDVLSAPEPARQIALGPLG